MNDDDLDRLLTQHGERWRDEHERVADVDMRRVVRPAAWTPASRWVPLGAAAAVLAVLAVVVALPAPHRAGHRPAAGPSPSPSSEQPPAQRRVAIPGVGLHLDFLGGGRVILSAPSRPGTRSRIEVRSVAHPSVVSFALSSSWRKGGDVLCPTIDGDWLVYTDVQNEPSQYSPGPPEPWKLVARNVATGEQRTLDSGITDIGTDLACAIRDRERVAWTSGADTQISLYDVQTTTRTSLAVRGTPIGFSRADVLVTNTAQGRAVVSRVDPVTGHATVVASVKPGYVSTSGAYLLWLEPVAESDWTASTLHLCALSSCATADSARSLIDQDPDGTPSTAIGPSYVAWTSGDDRLTVRHFDGHATLLTGEGAIDSLAADGDLLVYVDQTDPSTPAEKDALVFVDLAHS